MQYFYLEVLIKRWRSSLFFICRYVGQVYWAGLQIDGLVQERRSSGALAMELRLPCTNPMKCAAETWSQDRVPVAYFTKVSIGSDNGLSPIWRQAII